MCKGKLKINSNIGILGCALVLTCMDLKKLLTWTCYQSTDVKTKHGLPSRHFISLL
jgi:hypothetical protein